MFTTLRKITILTSVFIGVTEGVTRNNCQTREEYADLYENREQDSRNLTEPLSNVSNGLGIFTAFSYDLAYFEVVKK